MTDQEIICTWMEVKPEVPSPPFEFWQGKPSPLEWWALVSQGGGKGLGWEPRYLHLDALWEVEERLADLRMDYYCSLLFPQKNELWWDLIHAALEQKIKALAAVLRPIVEARDGR